MKDGCSPQGQCGCCTVWVDGAPRVACVTPLRRVGGREVTTLEGLPEERRAAWADALVASGGSQCGFCTPGIVMRLAVLGSSSGSPSAGTEEPVERALLAHLCRCTGWQTIEEAARLVLEGKDRGAPRASGAASGAPGRDLEAAGRRATLEGGAPQRVGTDAVLGLAGFADDTAPPDASVAVPASDGGCAVAASPAEARRAAGRVQGRSSTAPLVHPIEVPPGDWVVTLRTTWVEPAYLEPDASWCLPGGEPASACANGGAFGGKRNSPVEQEASRLATERGEAVRVLWSREDVVRLGPKRPPVAGGVRPDGSGVMRVGSPPDGFDAQEWKAALDHVALVAPGIVLEQVPLDGPLLSLDPRAAVWAEAAALSIASRLRASSGGEGLTDVPIEVTGPSGGRAVATCRADGSIGIVVDAGPSGDEVVLRSYCMGAVHQALGLVRSEGIAVDEKRVVRDLTIRSFGILQARAMPRVDVTIDPRGARPVNGSDAVFAAVAAARWLADGLPPSWPTDRTSGGRR